MRHDIAYLAFLGRKFNLRGKSLVRQGERRNCSCKGMPYSEEHPSVKHRKQVNIAAETVPWGVKSPNSGHLERFESVHLG